MREEEIAADNGKVEKLTEHKSAEINVVSEKEGHVNSIMLCTYFIFMFAVFLSLVMNIPAEKLDQFLPLLVLVLNEPGGGPLPEELHEAALHLEPDVAR